MRKVRVIVVGYEDGGRMYCGFRSILMFFKIVIGIIEFAFDRD